MRPDQILRRQRLRDQDGHVRPEALCDDVADASYDADVSGQHHSDADGRVDVAAARADGSPHDDGHAEAGGEADVHRIGMLAAERRAQGADHEDQEKRRNELDSQIAVEAAGLELVETGGMRQLL